MSTNYLSWMSKYKDIPLNQLAIPGSHDAGMYKISWHTNIAGVFPSDNAQTQSKDIQSQLEAGVRYFDIRPGWVFDEADANDDSKKEGYAGHFDSSAGNVGCTGGKLKSMLGDVIKFLNECGNSEVVILKFSHYFQVTHKNNSVDETLLDDGEHNDVFNNFKQWLVNYVDSTFTIAEDNGNTFHWLYHNNDGKRLTEYTTNEITTSGTTQHAKVIAVFDGMNSSITMPERCYSFADMVPDSGNHPDTVNTAPNLPSGDFILYDCYSNTDSYNTMSSSTDSRGQIKKFNTSSYHSGDYYLLSWTLTMKNVDHVFDKISDLAATANGHLPAAINTMISNNQIKLSSGGYRCVPNIIYVDYCDTFVTDVCITVNDSLH
ncbi:hypothetical protein GCM10011514_07600 [Emticicia aquatilis]|uniref:Phosphatidylinositol diacylglycerol-lyase n=1 Tax=Emticicia aquatilis TaxID=1537369 RepID=A0A916YJH1_9BACT|nr:hypothetical protein [Emticicia aquatilis]GGD46064.1 hypothetical protein GCM10011514_07600 [Emticicia aquatilis]